MQGWKKYGLKVIGIKKSHGQSLPEGEKKERKGGPAVKGEDSLPLG